MTAQEQPAPRIADVAPAYRGNTPLRTAVEPRGIYERAYRHERRIQSLFEAMCELPIGSYGYRLLRREYERMNRHYHRKSAAAQAAYASFEARENAAYVGDLELEANSLNWRITRRPKGHFALCSVFMRLAKVAS